MEVREIDLTDRDRYVEGVPYEWFDLLRREDPVHWHEEADGPGFWAVTRYDDVVTVNRDNQLFSSAARGALIHEMDDEGLAQQRMMMLNMDPPMHTRYRLLVNKGFTPKHIADLEERARVLTNEILDRVCERGECDFVTDVAAELPLQIIAELMGVPVEDRHLVFDWSNRMIGSEDPEYAVSQEATTSAAMELYAYCHKLQEEKKVQPGEDIMSVLMRAEVDGEQLNELEVDMFFLLLCVAGNETTRNLIAHGMIALFDHPEQRAKLQADPSLMRSTVEEMLRWGTPVMHFRRTATADTEIGGHPIAAGDKVVIWYSSANRDETVFENPYDFDITRDPNLHVAFGGGGPHFCLGSNLARMEIRVLFEELFKRLPDIEQAGPASRLRSNFINGIKHLPVRFAPGAPVGAPAS